MNKNRFFILTLLLALLTFPLIHETGHFIIARLVGGEVLHFNYFYISIIPNSINSIQNMILFKYGGLVMTFYPSLIIYLYLYRIKHEIRNVFLVLTFLSPLCSISDFIDVYVLLA